MKIKFLKAFNGDAIWISFSEGKQPRNIIIDGGIGDTYKNKLKRTGELYEAISTIRNNGEFVDLLILTHYDDDHIGGILKWLNNDKTANTLIKKVWFNSGKAIAKQLEIVENNTPDITIQNDDSNFETGIEQGIKFEKFLSDNKLWDDKIIKQGDTYELFGLKFKILSPSINNLKKLLKEYENNDDYFTAEDNDFTTSLESFIQEESSYRYKFTEDSSVANGSSIAFIMEYEDRKFIFLADAHPTVIIDGLRLFNISPEKKITACLMKISHHGSKFNTNAKLLDMIDTDHYLISSNGNKHGLPNKRTLARIILNNPKANIHFNYSDLIGRLFTKADQESFKDFKAITSQEFEF